MTPPVCEPGAPGPVKVFPATSDCEIFGYSAAGRPLVVNYCGNPRAELRIFVLAGQHGDEPDARDAAAEFIEEFLAGAFRPPVHMAVVVDANPDGAAAGTRRNAEDIDLNRDHLLLSSPETEAIHAFVDVWKPDLMIDVHTYRPWRKELLPFDFVFPQEMMLDFPTNPAVRTAVGPTLLRSAMDFVGGRMAEANIRSERYTLIRPGIVRHSTADILDARNNLALRFEIPSVLIEGRRGSPDDSLRFTEPRIALLRTIEALVDWASENARQLRRKPVTERGDIPVRCRYAGSAAPRFMEMQSASRGEISRVRLPGSYLPAVKPTKSVNLPSAYAVPHDLTGVLDILGKHRFATVPNGISGGSVTETFRVQSLLPLVGEDSPALPVCAVERGAVNLESYVHFPVRQTGGNLLALLLEPESQFGPYRIPELAAALQPGMTYPVVRVR